jgi:alpha-mannosidase
MFEWAGKSGNVEITVPKGATGAVETNLLEQTDGQPITLNADSISVPIRAYEILAVRADYPDKAQ